MSKLPVLVQWEGLVYQASPDDDLDRSVLAGQLAPGFVNWAVAASEDFELRVWSPVLSARPGGILLMIDWLRSQMRGRAAQLVRTLDVSFPMAPTGSEHLVLRASSPAGPQVYPTPERMLQGGDA